MGKKPTLGEEVEITGPSLGEEVEVTFEEPQQPSFPSAPSSAAFGGGGAASAGFPRPAPMASPSMQGGGVQPSASPLQTEPKLKSLDDPGRVNLMRQYWQSELNAGDIKKEYETASEAMRMSKPGTPDYESKNRYAGEILDRFGKAQDYSKKLKGAFDKDIDTIADEAISLYGDWLLMDKDGVKFSDPTKTMGAARYLSAKLGIEDEDFQKVLYDRLKSKSDVGIVAKEADKKFEQTRKGLDEEFGKRMGEAFTEDDAIAASAKARMASMNADYSARIKADADAVSSSIKQDFDAMDAEVKALNADYEARVNALNRQIEAGAIPQQQAEAAFAQMNEAYKQQFAQYEQGVSALNAKSFGDISAINRRYNSAFAQEQKILIAEAEEATKRAAEKFAKEFGDSEEGRTMRAKYKRAYEEDWKRAMNERGESIQGAADKRWESRVGQFFGNPIPAFTERFAESTVSGLGGSLKGIATTTGLQDLYLLGEEMERITALPEAKSDSIADLFEGRNLAQLSGQLAGGMAPSIAASAVTAAATGGMSIPARLALTGAAGWGAETMDLAGRAYDDVLRETRSREKASEAAYRTLKGQVQLMPAYAFDGLPFIGKALDFVPTKAGRVLAGGMTEYGTEMFQEIPQSVAEKNIREGRENYEGFADQLGSMSDSGELRQLLIGMAPITVLGGAGQVTSKSAKRQLEDGVKEYILKSRIADVAPDVGGQWVDRMQRERGTDFTRATIASLMAGGHIDEAKAEELLKTQESVMRLRDEAGRIRLNDDQARIYTALGLQESAMRQRAEAEQSPLLKKAFENRANDIFKSIEGFVNNGTKNYVEVKLGEGNDSRSIILDTQAAGQLLNDSKFISEVAKMGDFAGIDFHGEVAAEMAADFQGKVANVSDLIERSKYAKAERMMGRADRIAKAEARSLNEQMEEAANAPPQAPAKGGKRRKHPRISIDGEPLVEESVIEPPLPIRIEGTPLEGIVGGRAVFARGDERIEGDVYLDGRTVVIETPERVYEVGNVDDLSSMTAEDMPLSAVPETISVTEDGAFVYAGADPGIAKGVIVPQGSGLKAIKRGKDGGIKRIVVTDADGNTKNIRGQEAEDLAYRMMLRAVENNQSALTKDDSITEEIDAEHARQTEAASTAKADAPSEKGPSGRDGGGGRAATGKGQVAAAPAAALPTSPVRLEGEIKQPEQPKKKEDGIEQSDEGVQSGLRAGSNKRGDAIPEVKKSPPPPAQAPPGVPLEDAGEVAPPKEAVAGEGVMVRLHGNEYELVEERADGTATLRNNQGDEFDTAPGEAYTKLATVKKAAPVSKESGTKKQFVEKELDGLRQRRKAAYDESVRVAEGLVPADAKVPVGISKLTWLMSRPRHSKEQKEALTKVRVAEQNLNADTRTDAENYGRVYDRLQGAPSSSKEVAAATDEPQPAKKQEEPPKPTSEPTWKREGQKSVEKPTAITDEKNKSIVAYSIPGFEDIPIVSVKAQGGWRPAIKVGDTTMVLGSADSAEGMPSFAAARAWRILEKHGREKVEAMVEKSIKAREVVKGTGVSEQRPFRSDDADAIGFNYTTDAIARERFDLPSLEKIGSGSDRDVYDLGDGRVLKIAKTARGLEQNMYEGEHIDFLPDTHEKGMNYVVVDKVEPAKASDVIEYEGYDGGESGTTTIGEMLKELSKFSQKDADNHTGAFQDAVNKYGFNDVMNYNILWNDFIAKRNWGVKDGRAIHLDGGTFGGVRMIDDFRGKKNLDDSDFREIYNRSRAAKKQFGDKDKATMYQRHTDSAPIKTGRPRLDRVLNAMKDMAPGLNIIVHDTKQAYSEAVSKEGDGLDSSWGVYAPISNTIHVSPASPDLKQTLFHETAHPIILALARNNPDRLVDFVHEVRNHPDGKRYQRFASRYRDLSVEAQMNEVLAEFMGDVASGKVPVSTKPDSLWQRFKDFIKDILAALGWDMRSIDLSKPDNVREFAAQFKKAVDKGIRITGLTPVEGATLSLQDDADRVGLGVPLMQRPKTTKATEWNSAVKDALENSLLKGDEQAIQDAASLITDEAGKAEFIRVMNEQMGVATPPMGTKSNQKKVSKAYLRDELKKAVEAGKRAGIADVAKARKEFVAQVKDLLSKDNFKGSLSDAQARSITARAAGVNPLNPKAVERFTAYAEKVAADASYAERMDRIRGAQKSAKRRNHSQFQSAVNDFLKADPESIPDELVGDYMEALADMAKPVPSYRAMQEAYYPLMQALRKDNAQEVASSYDYGNEAEALWERIKDAERGSVQDYVGLRHDIAEFKRKMNALLESEAITDEAYNDVMDALDERISGAEASSELTSLKTDIIHDLSKRISSIGTLNLTPETKAVLGEVYGMTNDELRSLSIDELMTLSDILENAKEDGFVDVFRLDPIIAKGKGRFAAEGIAKQVAKAKPIKDQASLIERLRVVGAAFWESALGLGKVKFGAYHKALIAPIQKASGAYTKMVQDGRTFLREAKRKHKLDAKSMDRIGMAAIYLREYALSFDPKHAGKKDKDGNEYGTRDWFKEILAGDMSRYAPKKRRRMKKAWESLPKNADGKVDPQAVYAAYRDGTDGFLTKQEMDFLREASGWSNDNLKEKQRTSNYLRGKPFEELMFHVHRKRMGKVGDAEVDEDAAANVTDRGNVKLASSTGKAATTEDITPIEFNYEELFDKALNETARDYHYTPALRRANAVMKAVRALSDKDKHAYMDVTAKNIQEAVVNEFAASKQGFLGKRVVNPLMKARAAQVFIDVARTGIELFAGYAGYAMRAGSLRGYANVFKDMGIVDSLLKDTRSPLLNRTNLNKHLEMDRGELEHKSAMERLSHAMAAAPERLLLKPVWYGRFQDEFADITGQEFDAKKYEKDERYRHEHRKAIEEAATIADGTYERIAGAATSFGERRRIQVIPMLAARAVGESSLDSRTTVGKLASFMTGYPHREWIQLVDSFSGMVAALKEGSYEGRKGDMAKLAMGPIGILANVILYNYLRQLQYAVTNLLSADDDDEKEKAQEDMDKLLSARGVSNELLTGLVSLGSSKYSGAGRQLLKAAGSVMYNITDDKEEKAVIKSMVRNITFQNPYALPSSRFMARESMYGTVGEAIVPLATAVENYNRLLASSRDFDKMTKRLKDGEPLEKEEQEAVIALAFGVNVFNAIGQHFGKNVPPTLLNKLSGKYTPESEAQKKRALKAKAEQFGERIAKAKTDEQKRAVMAEAHKWTDPMPEAERVRLHAIIDEERVLSESDPIMRRLQAIQSPEERAETAWEAWKGKSKEERRKLAQQSSKVPGVASDRFVEHFMALEKADQ